MTERERRFIKHMREARVLEDLYAQGISPDDVKVGLLALFAPYSQNQDALQRYVIEYMVADAITLTSIMDSRWAMQLFEEALRVYRTAISTDRSLSLRTMGARLNDESAALSIYWRQYNLSHDMAALDLEEFVHESLRLIGTLVEGVLKPLLYGLAHQVRIGRGQRPSVGEVDALTLGNIVETLIQAAAMPECYSIRGVRLSQWRNIAQHFTAEVHENLIVCRYNDGRAHVPLTRDELSEVVFDVARAHRAIKVAHAIVFFDHLAEMQDGGMLSRQTLRPEASIVVLVSALASQGFQVVDASFTDKHSQLVVQDISNLEPNMRRIHTTQFVIPLFFQRPAERVTVEYRERDGTPSLRTSASRALMERAKQADDFTIVASEAELTDLKATQ